MLSLNELPRKDGVVCGRFCARHKSGSFLLEGYGFKFVGGVTGELPSRIHERLAVAYGGDVTFEPMDPDSGLLALNKLEAKSNVSRDRISRLSEQLSKHFGEPGCGEGEEPGGGEGEEPGCGEGEEPGGGEGEEPGGGEGEEPGGTPTTLTQLEAIDEAALRDMAAELGVTDKRWSVARLQRFIADQLGIEQ